MFTVWTAHFESSYRAILQRCLSFWLHHSSWEGRVGIFRVNWSWEGRSVLLWVNTKTLGNKVNTNTINLLNKTGNWWQKLIHIVPVSVWDKFSPWLDNLIKTVSALFKRKFVVWFLSFFTLFIKILTDDVAYEILDKFRLSFTSLLDQSISNNNMRQRSEVWIFRWRFGQLLSNYILSEINLAWFHLFTNFWEVVVKNNHNIFTLFSWENLFQDLVTYIFG